MFDSGHVYYRDRQGRGANQQKIPDGESFIYWNVDIYTMSRVDYFNIRTNDWTDNFHMKGVISIDLIVKLLIMVVVTGVLVYFAAKLLQSMGVEVPLI